MKRFFTCFKGVASSSNAVQRREKVYDDEPSDPNAPLFPTDPSLPANCGQPYQWQEILSGTVNLQQSSLLGRGNFGKVYLCHFDRTNEDAAVKIQERIDQTCHDEFLAEVITLHAANHPNVIKLLGRCYGRRNRAIVSKNGVEKESEISPVKGTPGWIAPETRNYQLVSTKSDVYSYGVFLFVLFTGRKANDPQKSFTLTDWVMQLWTSSEYEPVDVVLGNKYSVEGLSKIYETARMCINLQPHARPSMSDVETMVREAATFPVPKVERRLSF